MENNPNRKQREEHVTCNVFKEIFFDFINGKKYTTTKEIIKTTKLSHSQVSNAVHTLKKKKLILKPENATVQDGKWTMLYITAYKYRKVFMKLKKYKYKYCSHLQYLNSGRYKCPILGVIICNPECSCIQLDATVINGDSYIREKIPLCDGFTQQKSNEMSREISSELILRRKIQDALTYQTACHCFYNEELDKRNPFYLNGIIYKIPVVI